MTNEETKKLRAFLTARAKFVAAACELLEAWPDDVTEEMNAIMSSKYPAGLPSFDEVVASLLDWNDSAVARAHLPVVKS